MFDVKFKIPEASNDPLRSKDVLGLFKYIVPTLVIPAIERPSSRGGLSALCRIFRLMGQREISDSQLDRLKSDIDRWTTFLHDEHLSNAAAVRFHTNHAFPAACPEVIRMIGPPFAYSCRTLERTIGGGGT
ncbi:hypothetical protein DM01DRAFT_1107571 [Hesseltinella vesiculosa]|uniref:Uncharacterized protein n=1 Tax=Hesseltinella vesiculosa TaxID=101127 RepID=A0A1X2GB75_9FUNG|nr:hypothetical protein DM01DRAFT_1107571 [Hesseltinella vesiculosa]